MTFKFGPLQQKWLEALESDKYQQAEGTLKDERFDDAQESVVGYCCLGVANLVCDLGENWNEDTLAHTYKDIGLRSTNGSTAEGVKLEKKLSKAVWQSKEREEASAVFDKENAKSLTVMNDAQKTFKEIAAALRANPEDYFTESK